MAETFFDKTTEIFIPNPSFRAVVALDSLDHLPEYLAEESLGGRAFVLTDSNVGPLYGNRVKETLDDSGIETTVLEMPAGEENKTLETAANFVDALSERNATRQDTVIALGGGVVGDLGGWVASIYNRGVPLVQVPTTVLAMVDSSIGGKTGVDLGGKNKTGSFYHPKLVVADPNVLQTLDRRVYAEGFGEVVKYGMLDDDFFSELTDVTPNIRDFPDYDIHTLVRVIANCVKQKSEVIADDPLEQKPNGRILLNYGHTLAHGLEAAGGYTELLHGEAVSIGMNFAAKLAVAHEIADPSLVDRQEMLLEEYGLPLTYSGEATVDEVMSHIAKDKKNTAAANTRFVLPVRPGEMKVTRLDNATVKRFVEDFLSLK